MSCESIKWKLFHKFNIISALEGFLAQTPKFQIKVPTYLLIYIIYQNLNGNYRENLLPLVRDSITLLFGFHHQTILFSLSPLVIKKYLVCIISQVQFQLDSNLLTWSLLLFALLLS